MLRLGRLIHRIPFRQQRFIFAPMPLVGGDEADTAMPVFVVIPSHKVAHPLPGGLQTGEAV